MKLSLLSLSLVLILTLSFTSQLTASTAAFGGEVIEVGDPPNKNNTLKTFTVKINYFDYISWGKFGKHSKVGETITRQVKKLGTVCMIDGRMVNAATFTKVIQPGQWGYFYEDTWLDLKTTPDFVWGEFVSAEEGSLTLRLHPSNKEYHMETNKAYEKTFSYDAKTSFRIENVASKAESALKKGNWIQIHVPREQILSVWSQDTAFDPSEVLPAEEGKRGFANDLSCSAVLGKVSSKTPEKFIDLSATVHCTRTLKGKTEEVEINAKKTTFVLDGKVAQPAIAGKAGRSAVLGYYRREKAPHKIFVSSQDDSIRGVIKSISNDTLVVTTPSGPQSVKIEKGAKLQVNGVKVGNLGGMEGNEIVIYPKRGRTVIAFKPQGVK